MLKAFIAIQLIGCMHIVNPMVSLCGTVSRGKSGLFKFFQKNVIMEFNKLLRKMKGYNDTSFKTTRNIMW